MNPVAKKSVSQIEPPHSSRVFVRNDQRVVITDFWQKWKGRSYEARIRSRARPTEIGINDFGILRGEEPPIDRNLGTGAIYVHGCPLRCQTCYQPEFFAKRAKMVFSQEMLLSLCRDLRAQGAGSLSIVMASYQKPVIDVVRNLRKEHFDLPLVLNFSGSMSQEQLADCLPLFDIFVPDMKAITSDYRSLHGLSPRYTERCLAALEFLIRSKKETIVRHLLLPQAEDPLSDLRCFLAWLPTGLSNFSISLLTEYFDSSSNSVYSSRKEVLEEAEALIRNRGVNLFLQNRGHDDYSI